MNHECLSEKTTSTNELATAGISAFAVYLNRTPEVVAGKYYLRQNEGAN